MRGEAEELGRTLLAELGGAAGLTHARRLSRGAVLAGAQLDLTDVGAAAWTVLRGLDPAAGLRGLWLGDDALAAGAALAGLLARHAGLEHVELAGNALGDSAPAVVQALLAGGALRSIGLADNAIDGATLARLARMLEGTGVLHVGLGRHAAGAERRAANLLDAAATAAWAAAIERAPGWVSLDLRGLALREADAERLARAFAGAGQIGRLAWDLELPEPLRAALCHRTNRARVAPPPDRARLLRTLPTTPEPPPLPAAWDELADELAAATRLVERLAAERGLLLDAHPQVAALRRGVARLLRVERREGRRAAHAVKPMRRRQVQREEDRRRTEDAQIRRRSGGTAASDAAHAADATIHELHTPRPCYICKQRYTRLHFFYDRLCPTCAAESYGRRGEAVDLRGCQAIVTGGRIKIGFEVALRLLRWGARVLVTSRFPRDTIRRFAAQPDFAGFKDRVQVHGLDLRAVPAVELFAAHVAASLPRVDILINNAAQTVRRAPEALAAIAAEEALALPPGLEALVAGATAPIDEVALPALARGEFGEPLDARADNSWRLRLHEVGTVELLEVQLVNVVAPTLLSARLRPVMARRRADDAAYIVQVSAPEGRFDRGYKSPYHPHTNMAKAALNMMTRTSAAEYADDGIYMTSVDPGWASNENPAPIAAAMRARGFMPPLDLVDAATRVCDPIARGRRDGERLHGVFLKDFRAISW